MEIKYTLEILTKDIQDIGKLVENLHNSPDGSTLELDLALSKLRNVYDVLNDIRTDISTQRKPGSFLNTPDPRVETPVERPETEPAKPKEAEPVKAHEAEPVKAEAPESVKAEESEAVKEPAGVQSRVDGINPGIIAEKFSALSSINENMAGTRDRELEAKHIGPPVDNIGRNIGINDRFLIIRELFDGDSDGFGKLIKDLDNAAGLQEANERLQKQFKDKPNHEGVAILGILVKRRFSAT